MKPRLPKIKHPFCPTPIVRLETIPGFLEATEQEQEARDEAYLFVNKSIAGFEVTPLLFRQYLMLRFIRSPLIYGGTPSQIDLARFLWMLSPKFGARRWFQRRIFMRRCRAAFKDISRAAAILDAARAYIADANFDTPKGGQGSSAKEYYSDACAICNLFGREMGRSRDETLNTPMAVLMQELREVKHEKLGDKAGLTNPSDMVTRRWAREQNEKTKANN